ncbi:twin-arginine translocase subunit TatC [Solemya velum gill symbiont]|uniref:Sec-independent protein translocase protein TatC n=1 Tax=Solemya velum gill symbiont TaxID=2340 RepID=A0A0B0HAH5_SOVGS|nr:twin-arginine translocase subunit TatC [Solemya velum gill symbiont]KHF25682.1 twin arginine-targeting protein translocase TatABC, subunit C [Solemya velum gill symbiont]OOY35717.1 twin arginine-targeting protein translocase TatC [Solemya velum gill symbiont]OOY38345.1 twin arginine-targeting protein translocase TatC [Solemya velum gill symbiont]OOY40944.1 twin arginine-targeting protein translocase TatC [Solemya velum gill symbiont]OOY46258.1 twin arginine-targeting protein translocase Tat
MSLNVDTEQPFFSHLFELRDRLIRIVVVILVAFLALFSFGNQIYTMVAEPLMQHLPEGTSMIATEVASPFLTPMKLSLVAAIFLTIPFTLYQFWAFIAPGLYKHERKMVIPLVVSSTLLFYLGVAFAFYVVFPLVFAFLTGTAPEGVAVMTDMGRYLDFILTLFFAFGLAFEVPIAVIILIWTGATTREKLSRGRPYVIVGAFVLGMLLTPPDVISQTLLALPMWVLFEFGLIASSFFVRKKRDDEEEESDDDNEPDSESDDVSDDDSSSDKSEADTRYPDDYVAPTDEEKEAELDRLEWEDEDDWAEDEDDESWNGPGDDAESPDATGAEDADAIINDLNESRLKRVMELRQQGDVAEARKLLYEVLANGNNDQIMVARNILEQLDQE